LFNRNLASLANNLKGTNINVFHVLLIVGGTTNEIALLFDILHQSSYGDESRSNLSPLQLKHIPQKKVPHVVLGRTLPGNSLLVLACISTVH
jgi:hypothetical protein